MESARNDADSASAENDFLEKRLTDEIDKLKKQNISNSEIEMLEIEFKTYAKFSEIKLKSEKLEKVLAKCIKLSNKETKGEIKLNEQKYDKTSVS